MKKRFLMHIVITTLIFTSITLGACAGKEPNKDVELSQAQAIKPTPEDTVEFIYESDTVTPTQIPEPRPKEDPDYDSYIPEIKFGSLLFAFKNDDVNGKTMLYGDVTYNNMENYYVELMAFGFSYKDKDTSKSKDYFNATVYNKKNNVYVTMKYSETGMCITVYFEDDA